jgi:hypothetical protein
VAVAERTAGRAPTPLSDGFWLKILGVVGGGATAFFVLGAMGIWMRLWLLSLPPDRALAAISKQDIVAISVRGMFLLDAVAFVLGWWIFTRRSKLHPSQTPWTKLQEFWRRRLGRGPWVRRYAAGLFPAWVLVPLAGFTVGSAGLHVDNHLAVIGAAGFVGASAVGLYGFKRHGSNDVQRQPWDTAARWLYLLSMVYAATWSSWSMLGVAVAVLIADRVGGQAVRQSLRSGSRDKTRALTGLLAATLLGGMLIQVGEPMPLAAAKVEPQPADTPDGVKSFPYLGESNGYVYLVHLSEPGRYDGQILTLKRDGVSVTFQDPKKDHTGTLTAVDKSPAQWLGDQLSSTVPDTWHRFFKQAPTPTPTPSPPK